LASVDASLAPQDVAAPALAQRGQGGRAIVGCPAEGTADIMTRMNVEQRRGSPGRPMIGDNRPGAGARLVLETLKSLPADGDAFVATTATWTKCLCEGWTG